MFRLTPVEMILFLLAVVASLYFGYRGFKKVYLIIKRSQGEPPIKEIPGRLWNAAVNWIAPLAHLASPARVNPAACLYRLGLYVLLPGERARCAQRLHRVDHSRHGWRHLPLDRRRAQRRRTWSP